jgi:hypothetical protein
MSTLTFYRYKVDPASKQAHKDHIDVQYEVEEDHRVEQASDDLSVARKDIQLWLADHFGYVVFTDEASNVIHTFSNKKDFRAAFKVSNVILHEKR